MQHSSNHNLTLQVQAGIVEPDSPIQGPMGAGKDLPDTFPSRPDANDHVAVWLAGSDAVQDDLLSIQAQPHAHGTPISRARYGGIPAHSQGLQQGMAAGCRLEGCSMTLCSFWPQPKSYASTWTCGHAIQLGLSSALDL